MPKYKKEKIAIVSQGFWPQFKIIGGALLTLSEKLTDSSEVVVITQVKHGFKKALSQEKRGTDVNFSTIRVVGNNNKHITLRILNLSLFSTFVFLSLVKNRPDKVYITTTPPIFPPLAVLSYCKLFRKQYYYHIQDIHPEATQLIMKKPSAFLNILKLLDNKTVSNAKVVITLSTQMEKYLESRVGHPLVTKILSNPSAKGVEPVAAQPRIKGFVYCGNLGRFQRIPLLIESIEKYIAEGGKLPFVFAGDGIHSGAVRTLANKHNNVQYLGKISPEEASALLYQYSFGLMPIEDNITNYAFPSKSSSYLYSGCYIIAICGSDNSVAEWVTHNKVGIVSNPTVSDIVQTLQRFENQDIPRTPNKAELLQQLLPEAHAEALKNILTKE